MKRLCTSLVLGGLLALGTGNAATAQQRTPRTPAPTTPTPIMPAPGTLAPRTTGGYSSNGPGVLPNGGAINPATTPVVPGTTTPTTTPPGYSSNGPGVLPNGGRGIVAPSTPAISGAGSPVVPPGLGSATTTAPVSPQFNRLFSGLNVVVPPTSVAVPTGAMSPVVPSTGIPSTVLPGTTTPGTATGGYSSNGPGVAPNGGRGIPLPSTPAISGAGNAVVPATPPAATTTAPVSPQFNRLFGGLSAAVPTTSTPTQTSPGTTAPGYNSNGPGVVPNGGRTGP